MLNIILDVIKTYTRLGVNALKSENETALLVKYGIDAEKMLDGMDATYNTIIEHDGNFGDFIHNIFKSLLSHSNQVLQNFI